MPLRGYVSTPGRISSNLQNSQKSLAKNENKPKLVYVPQILLDTNEQKNHIINNKLDPKKVALKAKKKPTKDQTLTKFTTKIINESN